MFEKVFYDDTNETFEDIANDDSFNFSIFIKIIVV